MERAIHYSHLEPNIERVPRLKINCGTWSMHLVRLAARLNYKRGSIDKARYFYLANELKYDVENGIPLHERKIERLCRDYATTPEFVKKVYGDIILVEMDTGWF